MVAVAVLFYGFSVQLLVRGGTKHLLDYFPWPTFGPSHVVDRATRDQGADRIVFHGYVKRLLMPPSVLVYKPGQ